MPKVSAWIFLASVIVIIGLMLLNDSRLAESPGGSRIAVSLGGVHPLTIGGECDARKMKPSKQTFLANTVNGIRRAYQYEADMVLVDVAPTADGQMVLFADTNLDCRTDGTGPVRKANLADLKKLDIGYGYTADGGATYPLRGKGRGMMPTLEEGLQVSNYRAVMYRLTGADAVEGELLIAKLKAAKRDPERWGDGFIGPKAAIDRIRTAFPKSWTIANEEAAACTSAYKLYGWTSIVPSACSNATLMIPIDGQFFMWGWPNRTQLRMNSVGAKIMLTGPAGDRMSGLTTPDQVPHVPEDYFGAIMVDDIETLGASF